VAIAIGVLAGLLVVALFAIIRILRAKDAAEQASFVRGRQVEAAHVIHQFVSLPRRERRKILAEINRRNLNQGTRKQEEEILARHAPDEDEEEGSPIEVVE
jgi:biopolymer transport protein ExbB/TolQ